MSFPILKQNARILVEVAENYEKLLIKRRSARKEDIPPINLKIRSFRKQFLYLLSAIDKGIKEEKNAR